MLILPAVESSTGINGVTGENNKVTRQATCRTTSLHLMYYSGDYRNLGTSDKSISNAYAPQGKEIYFKSDTGDYDLGKYNKSDN